MPPTPFLKFRSQYISIRVEFYRLFPDALFHIRLGYFNPFLPCKTLQDNHEPYAVACGAPRGAAGIPVIVSKLRPHHVVRHRELYKFQKALRYPISRIGSIIPYVERAKIRQGDIRHRPEPRCEPKGLSLGTLDIHDLERPQWLGTSLTQCVSSEPVRSPFRQVIEDPLLQTLFDDAPRNLPRPESRYLHLCVCRNDVIVVRDKLCPVGLCLQYLPPGIII